MGLVGVWNVKELLNHARQEAEIWGEMSAEMDRMTEEWQGKNVYC